MSPEQNLAVYIFLAYVAGMLAGGALLYYLISRSEEAGFAQHRKTKPQMQLDEDIEAIMEAISQ